MSSCVRLVYFQSLVGLRLLLVLSYELGVNGEKNVNGNSDIINKNGHSTFHSSKPENINSLREII